MNSRKCDVLIAGAGPAGLAAALHLLRLRPALGGRVVALEKARHPRPKVCAGGLIPKALAELRELGIALDVPAVSVTNGHAVTPAGDVSYSGEQPVCTIIRRDQFDAMLAKHAKAAGLEILEDCRVESVTLEPDGVLVRSNNGDFHSTILVGADGSGSRVRRCLSDSEDAIGRALMLDIEVDPATAQEFRDSVYRFDFNCVRSGIPGYRWSFPCIVEGRPHVNIGIYEQFAKCQTRSGNHSALIEQLIDAFPEFLVKERIAQFGYRAFPIRWHKSESPAVFGKALLAGDAAGVDPLMGEGISCALEHGKLAARPILDSLDGDPAALGSYDHAVRLGSVGKKLRRLGFAARRFYGPRHQLYFKLAGMSRTAMQIGINWYNGESRYDELPIRTLLGKWAVSVLTSRPIS